MLTNFFAINIIAISVENFEKFFNKIDKISFTKKQLKKIFYRISQIRQNFQFCRNQQIVFQKKMKLSHRFEI